MSAKTPTTKPAQLIKFPTLSSAPQIFTQIIQHASAQHQEKRHAQRISSKKFEKHLDSDSYDFESEEISTDTKKHKKLPLRQRRRRRRVRDKQILELPRLTFCGTVKLEGINAVIVRTEVEDADAAADANRVVVSYQSKTKILTPEKDLEGFAAHFALHEEAVIGLFERLDEITVTPVSKGMRRMAVFGRWCRKGFSGDGKSTRDEERMFVVFAVRRFQKNNCSGSEQAIGGEWLDMPDLKMLQNAEARISNVFQFQAWEVEVDFSNEAALEKAQEQMASHTQSITKASSDNQHSGHDGQAQGIIWRVVLREDQSEEYKIYARARFWFETSASHDPGRPGKQAQGKPRNNKEKEKAPMCQDRNVEKLLHEILPTSRLDQVLQVLQQQQQQPQPHPRPHPALSPTHLATYISELKTAICTSTELKEKAKIEKAKVDVEDLMAGVEARAKWWFRQVAKRARERERSEFERERRVEEESEADCVCAVDPMWGINQNGGLDIESDTESNSE